MYAHAIRCGRYVESCSLPKLAKWRCCIGKGHSPQKGRGNYGNGRDTAHRSPASDRKYNSSNTRANCDSILTGWSDELSPRKSRWQTHVRCS